MALGGPRRLGLWVRVGAISNPTPKILTITLIITLNRNPNTKYVLTDPTLTPMLTANHNLKLMMLTLVLTTPTP